MEHFNVTLKQGRFSTEPKNIRAISVEDLNNSLANFCKDTQELIDSLISKGMKGLARSRITKGGEMNLTITYTEDGTTVPIRIKQFGTFVRSNSVTEISSAFNLITEHQLRYGHLFSGII